MPLPLIIAGVGALAKVGLGFGQQAAAKHMAERNRRPTFNIQDEYFNNQNIAENEASNGLSAASKELYTTQSDRAFTAGTDAILQTGGSGNSVAAMYEQYNRGMLGLASEDSQLRTAKMKTLMDVGLQLAGQKTQKWVLDKYEPFKDTAKAAAAEKEAGIKNIFGGISELAGVAASAQNQGLFGEKGAGDGGDTSFSGGQQAQVTTPVATAAPVNPVTNIPTMGTESNGLSSDELKRIFSAINFQRI